MVSILARLRELFPDGATKCECGHMKWDHYYSPCCKEPGHCERCQCTWYQEAVGR